MKYTYRDCWHICKYADRNFTYIEIPKAGCSTIKHQMSSYFKERLKKPPVPTTSELTKFMGYSRGRLPKDHDSFVFTVLRDPIARFISGIKMLTRIKHDFIPPAVVSAYETNHKNPSWFLPFLENGSFDYAMNETHMTPIDFCIGNYIDSIEYACSIENLEALEEKLNDTCGTEISFEHLFKSDTKDQPSLKENHLDILLNKYELSKSYEMTSFLSKLHFDVIDYNPLYWLQPMEQKKEFYA